MMARRLLSPPDMNPDGIIAHDWVRKIGRKGVGQVESVTGDAALVDWLAGTKEIVLCVYLRRAPNCGEKYDRKPE